MVDECIVSNDGVLAVISDDDVIRIFLKHGSDYIDVPYEKEKLHYIYSCLKRGKDE